MTSEISRSWWRFFQGIRSTIKRRNFGEPSLKSGGGKYIRRNEILKAAGLRICWIREISNVQSKRTQVPWPIC